MTPVPPLPPLADTPVNPPLALTAVPPDAVAVIAMIVPPPSKLAVLLTETAGFELLPVESDAAPPELELVSDSKKPVELSLSLQV